MTDRLMALAAALMLAVTLAACGYPVDIKEKIIL